SPTAPRVFVSKWMDYSNKYGLGYQLTDGSVGVYFNDKTTLVMSPDGIHFEYVYNLRNSDNSVSSRRSFYTVNEHPKDLHKKLYLLKNFRRYMNESIVKNNSYTFVDVERTHNMEFVTKFKRTPHAILFRLSNRLIQVNFFDHEKIVLSDEGRVITHINEESGINTYAVSEVLGGNHSTIMARLKYVRDVLKKIVEAGHKNVDK
ncbi:15128_t:CDS:2, partial [Acaulospora colombiana]